MYISVIICTHNPKLKVLKRTLRALEQQNLAQTDWELLLVDNKSSEVLEHTVDLSWHPNARHLRENKAGLTAARLRGITDSRGRLLVFVDDDNVLAANYLSEAKAIYDTFPQIGAFCGEILGEYETPPPAWFLPVSGMIAVRPLDRDRWTNSYGWSDAMPCGAGMCLVRTVADAYLAASTNSASKQTLDRNGIGLMGGGDVDMAYTAIDLGYGVGRFKKLSLTHIVPSGRLELTYLMKLRHDTAYSEILLDNLRDSTKQKWSKIRIVKYIVKHVIWMMFAERNTRKIMCYGLKGWYKAIQETKEYTLS